MSVCVRMLGDIYSRMCLSDSMRLYMCARVCKQTRRNTVKRIPLRDRLSAPLILSIATRSALHLHCYRSLSQVHLKTRISTWWKEEKRSDPRQHHRRRRRNNLHHANSLSRISWRERSAFRADVVNIGDDEPRDGKN